jgi:ribosomal protein S18 acetylase RimI-like enzyme
MSVNYTNSSDNPTHFDQIHNFLQSEKNHMLVFSTSEIKEFVDKKQTIIALENDKVVGFVKYFSHGFDDKLQKNILECGSLVVDPKFRQQGIAKNLIINLSKNIPENSLLTAVVRRTNQVSEAFLRKINAKEIHKPKQLTIYPLGWPEEKFYFFNLSEIK